MCPHNLCTLCNQESETLKHLLVSCQVTQIFWSQICEKQLIEENINEFSILMNFVKPNPKFLANLIVLLAKFYIYRTHCNNGKLSIIAFSNSIKEIQMVEKYISIKNNKLGYHEVKWSNFS